MWSPRRACARPHRRTTSNPLSTSIFLLEDSSRFTFDSAAAEKRCTQRLENSVSKRLNIDLNGHATWFLQVRIHQCEGFSVPTGRQDCSRAGHRAVVSKVLAKLVANLTQGCTLARSGKSIACQVTRHAASGRLFPVFVLMRPRMTGGAVIAFITLVAFFATCCFKTH